MSREESIAKVEKLRAGFPDMAKEMDELIGGRKSVVTIGGLIRHFYKDEKGVPLDVTNGDVRAYVAHRSRWGRGLRPAAPAPTSSPLASPASMAESQGEASGSAAAANPMDETELDERIMRTFGAQIDALLDEAAKNPKSDAGLMLRVVLLNGMMRDRQKLGELDLQERFAMERKYREAEDRAERNDIARYNAESKRIDSEARADKLAADQQVVLGTLQQAKDAEKTGRPWNAAEVVSRISAAIGVSGPLVERVEPAPEL